VKQVVFALASVGITAASVLIALGGSWIVGGLGTVVFGAFTAALLAQLRGRHGLAVTPTRVVVDFNGHAELAWEDVEAIALRELFRSRFVSIQAAAPERVERTGGGWLARLNRAGDLRVPADGLEGDAARAVALLERYRVQPQARTQIGTADELARVI
jgi:hypothetical protein